MGNCSLSIPTPPKMPVPSFCRSSSFALVPELAVNPVAISHAVKMYKNMLEKIYMWDILVSRHSSQKISSFGELPERDMQYTVRYTKDTLQPWKAYISVNELLELRNNTLNTIIAKKYGSKTNLGDVSFERCTSLVQLSTPLRLMTFVTLRSLRGLWSKGMLRWCERAT